MSGSGEERGWKIHAALTDWTGKVDTKASFALTVDSALLGLVLTLSGGNRSLSHLHGWSVFLYALSIAALLIATLCAVLVVRPRLRSRKAKSEAGENYIYFGHLRHWQPPNLEVALEEHELLPALSRQLVHMSEIAWRKHRLVQWSINLATVGSVLAGAAAIAR